MSLPATPTTQGLRDAIVASLEASLSQTIPLLPKAFCRVLAMVLAGTVIILWRYVGAMMLQLFVSRASFSETTVNGVVIRPLVEWGRLVGAGDPRPATAAELTVTLPVENQVGSLAAGVQFLHAGSSILYVSTAIVALDASTVSVPVKAASDPDGNGGLGTVGNRAVGDKLALASPLANVAREATVASFDVPGTDAEAAETYRARVIRRFQRRPQGGATADYQGWGEEAQGIVAVYPYSADEPGVVNLFVEAETTEDNPDGIPTSDQLDEVEALANLSSVTNGKATRRPVTAYVTAMPIVRTGFNIEIDNLDVPDPVTTEAAISTAIDAQLREAEPFIVGLSTFPRKDRITEPAISGLVESIVSSEGGTFTQLRVLIGSESIRARTLGNGEKAKLGTISFL